MYKDDRRIFERFDVDFSAGIKQPEVGVRGGGFVRCCDISASGLGLIAEEKLIPDTSLEIWIGIPDRHSPIRGLAKVVWSKQVQEDKWRAGLEFARIDFMGLRRIFETKRRFSQI